MSNPKRKVLFRSLMSIMLLACSVVFVMRTQPTYAQGGKGTINGTVTDQSGAVVPETKVTLTETNTGTVRNVVTGSDGSFSAAFMPVGQYSVAATHAGFKTKTQTGIILTTDLVVTVNIALEVGQVSQSVEVSAAAQMINTTTAAIGDTITSRSVVELPLNGRDPGSLAFMAPGAYNGTQSSSMELSNTANGLPTETNAVVNGSRIGGVFYMLDGIQHMDIYLQTAQPFPNSDATQEFNVITNNFDAQYGFAPSAVVSIATRSGTNNWHGNAYEFVRNDKMDAADFFSHATSGLKRNQFGGSLGGPIKKDKAFIFGNLQFTQERTVAASNQNYVPTASMLNGDFSAISTPLRQYCPALDTTCAAYTGNQIDPSTFSTVMATNFEKLLPQPTNALGSVYLPGAEKVDHYREFTIKHDLYLSNKSHIMVRGFYQRYIQAAGVINNDWLQSNLGAVDRAQSYGGSWTYTPKPTVVNDFTLGFLIGSAVQTSPWTGHSWEGLGATDIPSPDNNLAWVNVPGFSPNFYTGIANHRNYTINDTVTWTKGKHLIVAGVNVLTNYNVEEAAWLADPLVNFSGEVTGSWYADFLMGYMNQYEQGGGEYNKYGGKLWGTFVQDTIRLKPNLTLDVGVRWEPQFAPKPIPNQREAFFWPGKQSTVYPGAPPGLVFPGDQGVPNGGYYSQLATILPRIGIAWQPKALKNTSIRAAFGQFSVPLDFSYFNHVGSNAPWSPTFYLDNSTTGGHPLSINQPFANFGGSNDVAPFPPFGLSNYVPKSNYQFVLPTGVGGAFVPQTMIMPREQSWNFSVEHQFTSNWLVRVAYVGSEAYHITNHVDMNPGIYCSAVEGASNMCGEGQTSGARTLFPNFGLIMAYQPNGTASYNSMQISVEKRFSRNFQFTSNYAYSKALDQQSASSIGGPSSNSYSDPFSVSHDKGLSDLNFPNILSNSGIWQLPGLKDKGRIVSSILGHWEVSGTLLEMSGRPFSINGGNGNNNSQDQEGTDRADLTGQPIGERQGSKSQWVNQYFNPLAFQQNAPGTFGNAPRNMLIAPRHFNIDAMIAKNFPFKETASVQFRCEMFNMSNTPFLDIPDNTPTDTNFGQIVDTRGAARIIQLALKLNF